MESIFDDEELFFRRSRVLLPALKAEAPGVTSVLVPTLPTQPVPSPPPGMRRRTVGEALERWYSIKPPTLEGLPYGIQRAARRPLGIYTAAWYLAAGLILVDPLDRLEGGLID
jgi:hypothetical protein